MYLHEVAEGEISFTKEDMHQGKHTEYERRLHEQIDGLNGHQQNSVGNHQSSGGGGKELKTRANNRTAE
jgi:hypothetical protein